jgi:hypothetical protein
MEAVGYMSKGVIDDVSEPVNSVLMGFELFVRPHCFKSLHEIGGRGHLESEASNQLNRTRIDTRKIWNGVQGRVLHGDLTLTAQEGRQEQPLLFP